MNKKWLCGILGVLLLLPVGFHANAQRAPCDYASTTAFETEPRIYKCACGGETKNYTVDIYVGTVKCTHVSNPTDLDMQYSRYKRYECIRCGNYLGSTYLGDYIYCYN